MLNISIIMHVLKELTPEISKEELEEMTIFYSKLSLMETLEKKLVFLTGNLIREKEEYFVRQFLSVAMFEFGVFEFNVENMQLVFSENVRKIDFSKIIQKHRYRKASVHKKTAEE